MSIKSTNDFLISDLCNNKDYVIHKDSRIFTLIQKTGKRSVKNVWRELIPNFDEFGYVRVRYKYKYLKVHRIIYQKFVGQLDMDLEINHIDGDRKNNDISNLELVTRSQNMRHSFHVLNRKPSYGLCKLNQGIADEIRVLSKYNTQVSLSKTYGVSKCTIGYIIHNKIWNKAA